MLCLVVTDGTCANKGRPDVLFSEVFNRAAYGHFRACSSWTWRSRTPAISSQRSFSVLSSLALWPWVLKLEREKIVSNFLALSSWRWIVFFSVTFRFHRHCALSVAMFLRRPELFAEAWHLDSVDLECSLVHDVDLVFLKDLATFG